MKPYFEVIILILASTLFISCSTMPPTEIALAKLKEKKITFDRKSFIEAARDGNIESVKLFIAAGMLANSIIEDEEMGIMSPLFASISEGHTEIANYLIDKGAADDEFAGRLALVLAVSMGNAEISEALLKKGVKTKMPHDRNITLLMIACGAGRESCLGENYSYDDQEMRKYINADIVELLLDFGVNVNEKDKGGCGALWYACLFGRKDLAELLLKAGAQIDNDIELDVPGAGKVKGTPTLIAAAASGNLELVKMLVAKGADINAVGSCFFGIISTSIKYVGKGDGKGFTALHSACYGGRNNIVEYLLEQRANINAKDASGKTPIMFARGKNVGIDGMFMRPEKIKSKDPIELIKLLYTKGANIDNNLFFEAVKNGHIETVLFLLEKGIKIDCRNEKGQTPLMIAGKNKHKDLYNILLKKGAKRELKDNDGRTAQNYLKDCRYSFGGLSMPSIYVMKKSSSAMSEKKEEKSILEDSSNSNTAGAKPE
ncbi:MAG: hypothetical protein GXP32_00775 [Kiritimatiellaeota bacterium]|nr:hypothetical protein [Kiritimatiellota bacterium]